MEYKIDYEAINDYLNSFCSSINGNFFDRNLAIFSDLVYEVGYTLENDDVKFSWDNIAMFDLLNPDFAKPKVYLPLFESIDIVRGYLEKKLPHHLELFDKYVSDGTFNFTDKELDENGKTISGVNPDGHLVVDVEIAHNLDDPVFILHEFCHLLNIRPLAKEREYRRVFTEGLSIFFETDMYNYMEELGYSLEEINISRRFRLEDNYRICRNLLCDLLLVDAFIKQGEITENTRDERAKLNIHPNWVSKDAFLRYLERFSPVAKEGSYNPMKSCYYVFGTSLAFHCINMDDPEIVAKVDSLNEKINTSEDFTGILKTVGINVSSNIDMYKMLESFNKEVRKINDTQKQETNTIWRS